MIIGLDVLFLLTLLIVGLYVLLKSSDLFVEAAANLAIRLGVLESLIGLTLVALGTSLPELVASLMASLKGNSGLVVGNVIGSNIANVGLILGITAIITPFALRKHLFARESMLVIITTFVFILFSIIGVVPRWGGFLLVVMYGLYVYVTMKRHHGDQEEFADVAEPFIIVGKKVHEGIVLVFSGIGIWLGARLAVDNAVALAASVGVSELVIGGTIIAVGTSLPELSVCLAAAQKGKGDLVLGNILGSNIANILLVLGVSAAIAPPLLGLGELLMGAAALLFAMLAAWYVHQRETLNRKHGIILVGTYLAVFLIQFLL